MSWPFRFPVTVFRVQPQNELYRPAVLATITLKRIVGILDSPRKKDGSMETQK
jgi:hypothetical protein